MADNYAVIINLLHFKHWRLCIHGPNDYFWSKVVRRQTEAILSVVPFPKTKLDIEELYSIPHSPDVATVGFQLHCKNLAYTKINSGDLWGSWPFSLYVYYEYLLA